LFIKINFCLLFKSQEDRDFPIPEKTYLRSMNGEHPGVRVKWIVKEYYQGRTKRLAEALDVSAAGLGKVVNEEVYPGYKVIHGILTLHPEISADWFIKGEPPAIRNMDEVHKVRRENEELRAVAQQLESIIRRRR